MVKPEHPVLFIAVLIPLISSCFFPLLEKKLRNSVLALCGFIILALPFLAVLTMRLIHGEAFFDAPMGFIPPLGPFSMHFDWLSGVFLIGIAAVTLPVALYAYGYMEYRIKDLRTEGVESPALGVFYMLYVIFSVAMTASVLSTNLIQIYIFLQMATAAGALLILLYGHYGKFHIGLMYLLWSAAGGALLLFGFVALGTHAGSFDVHTLQQMDLGHVPKLIPISIILGLLIKQGIFGVHIWLPYAHAEAPTPISALLSPNLIGISGYLMIRVVWGVFPHQYESMSFVLLALAYCTMIYGAMMALAQDDLKRLLAYSSISVMGWLLYGISTMTVEGIAGAAILFVTHSISSSVLFMSSGVLISRYGGLRNISFMSGLWSKNTAVSVLILLGFLTVLGAPFTVGFWSKTLIFSGAVAMAEGTLRSTAAGASVVLAAGFSAVYVLTAVRRILPGQFRWKTRKPSVSTTRTPQIPAIAVVVCAGVVLFFFPGPLAGFRERPGYLTIILEGAMFLTLYLITYLLSWKIYTGPPRKLASVLFYRVETLIIDKFFSKQVCWLILKTSGALKEIHNGALNNYLLWMLIGFGGIIIIALYYL